VCMVRASVSPQVELPPTRTRSGVPGARVEQGHDRVKGQFGYSL
jgi:hypothetical protein